MSKIYIYSQKRPTRVCAYRPRAMKCNDDSPARVGTEKRSGLAHTCILVTFDPRARYTLRTEPRMPEMPDMHDSEQWQTDEPTAYRDAELTKGPSVVMGSNAFEFARPIDCRSAYRRTAARLHVLNKTRIQHLPHSALSGSSTTVLAHRVEQRHSSVAHLCAEDRVRESALMHFKVIEIVPHRARAMPGCHEKLSLTCKISTVSASRCFATPPTQSNMRLFVLLRRFSTGPDMARACVCGYNISRRHLRSVQQWLSCSIDRAKIERKHL